ncbi:MAG: hypothetical protein CMP81_06120 [Fulvimarina sp.]|nr:hypothetical protein [Fulvimarina sp.]
MAKKTGLNIGEAMSAIDKGGRVTREDWPEGRMLQWFESVHTLPTNPHAEVTPSHPPSFVPGEIDPTRDRPIRGQRIDGVWVVWVPHQDDLGAADWKIL